MAFARLSPSNVAQIRPLRAVRFGWIAQIRWSPHGDKLAIAGGSGVAVYQGGFGGAPDLRLNAQAAPVKDIAWNPDGLMLAAGSADTTIKLWRIDGDAPVDAATLAGHTDSVEALAWLSDGRLASGGADGTIRLWDVATARQQAVLRGHSDELTSLAVDPGGRWLYSAGRDKSIRRWELDAGESSDIIGRHDDWIRDMALHPRGNHLASAGKDGGIRLWELRTGGLLRAQTAHAGGVDALAWSPNGRLLASGGRDKCLRIWNAATGDELAAFAEHRKPLLALAFHPAGAWLVTGGGDNRAMLWACPRAPSQ